VCQRSNQRLLEAEVGIELPLDRILTANFIFLPHEEAKYERRLLDGDGFGMGERNFIFGNDDQGIGTERAQQLSMLMS